MSECTIYHNPRCSKSRATLALLEEHGVSPEIVLYLESNPEEKEIRGLLAKLGITAAQLVRRGEEAFVVCGLGPDSSEDDYVAAIDYIVNLAGEESVGIGTDFTQGYDREFFEWITHDKGNARKLTEFGDIINPDGMRTIGDFPNLTEAMERAGWPEPKIRKIMGENWVRLLGDVWGKA